MIIIESFILRSKYNSDTQNKKGAPAQKIMCMEVIKLVSRNCTIKFHTIQRCDLR